MAARRPVVAAGLLAKPGSAPQRGTPIEALPAASDRTEPSPAIGLKTSTIGTTLYLLPEESRRLKHLAVDLGISVHEMILRGLDHILDENGQAPIRRYATFKEKKR